MKKLIAFMLSIFWFSCMIPLCRAVPVEWPIAEGGNGHYYERVDAPQGVTWYDAKATAETFTFLGVTGHLATITLANENSFIVNNLGGVPVSISCYWLGGFQPDGSPEPAGNWQWITGEPWTYTNWSLGEPNNKYGGESGGAPAGSDEEVLLFWGNQGMWNDMEISSFQRGFIVEYPVPEPGTFLLLGLGGLLFRRQRSEDRRQIKKDAGNIK